jgi:putative hydrolase of the HAD superfamily
LEHAVAKELYKTDTEICFFMGMGMIHVIHDRNSFIFQHTAQVIEKIIHTGRSYWKNLLNCLKVEEVLQQLKGHYRLVVATKGDLLDQERKLKKSGLESYFHHIEIMSDKQEADYLKLIRHLDIKPDEFLMIGNSLKSDCMPVLAIGGHAVHVPYHTTWVHEQIDHTLAHPNFREAEHIKDILPSLLS